MKCGARLRYWLYCVSSAMMNFSNFYFWVCISLLAYSMGASPLQLGIIQATSATITTTTSPFLGMLSDKLRPHWMVRASSLMFAAACAVLLLVSGINVWLYVLAVILSGLTSATYWPTVQATVAKEVDKNNVNRDMSRFAVFWSVGKSVGYMIAGYIFQYAGGKYSLAVPAAVAGSIMFWYPFGANTGDSKLPKELAELPGHHYLKLDEEPVMAINESGPRLSLEERRSLEEARNHKEKEDCTQKVLDGTSGKELSDPKPEDSTQSEDTRRTKDASTQTNPDDYTMKPEIQEIVIDMKISQEEVQKSAEMKKLNSQFLPLVYMLNFCVYGILATLNSQLIHLIKEYNIHIGNLVSTEQYLGVFMCTLFSVQTVMFVIFGMTTAWLYRLWLMFLVEGVLVLCLWGIAFIPQAYAVLAFGVGIGACAAFAIQSSIIVSLRMSETAKGKFAGINETVVSSGSAILPLVAGGFASLEQASPKTPYATCGCVIALCGVAQGCWYIAQNVIERRRQAKAGAVNAPASKDEEAK
ncbi:major facilitator superfamily protein [Pelomyxa schiedti]|nr:major facilitator superfamily protein [Pelomyxa schiedti]